MPEPKYNVFVLMPFANTYDGLFEYIRTAAVAADAKPERVDQQRFEKDVLQQIIGQIENADTIVAVMTGESVNVFYEVGFANALGKHLLLLTSDEKIPFDVAHMRHLVYRTVDQQPSVLQNPAKFTSDVTEELKYLLSKPRDSYFLEYKKAEIEMKSKAGGLAEYLVPVANQFFASWTEFVKGLVGGGVITDGPIRLDITSRLVHQTGQYRIVERIVGKPEALQSKDWLAFYDEIARDAQIRKVWILCVDEEELVRKRGDVVASCEFRKSKGFETHYCSPRELQRATGVQLPPYEAIEDYGQFAKFLELPDKTYASGKTLNRIKTVFRSTDPDHRRLIDTLIRCSDVIDDQWLSQLKARPAQPQPTRRVKKLSRSASG
jgi:hypothetical protein